MKQVFSSSEVAHIWASQVQMNGRNSNNNFYFDDGTIYSYGKHFPIATIVGDIVLFTLRTYSNTTAKHIGKVRSAVSHKGKIYCFEVPTIWQIEKNCLTAVHDSNINRWKGNIKNLFTELGNKRLRLPQLRVNQIQGNIEELNKYCDYFKTKIKDNELKALLKLAALPDFIEQARTAKDRANVVEALKIKRAAKAYKQYLDLWRKFDNQGIAELPAKVKELCNFYRNTDSLTHLRLSTAENRLETSKGVQIPVRIAKRAYNQLNGCIEGKCNGLNISVLHYVITETTDNAIIAGCHTIPKEDIKYIANLLNW